MREYASGTRRLMVHVRCLALPALDKYFPSLITRDDGQPLKPGQPATVTITVTGDEAPWFLAPGQEFSIWGGGRGHGVVSRRVFTNGGPS
jgi:hypothetical protein